MLHHLRGCVGNCFKSIRGAAHGIHPAIFAKLAPRSENALPKTMAQRALDGQRRIVTSPIVLTISGIVGIGTVRCPFFNAVEDDTQQILSPKILARHLSEVERR
jgi:hypothetical protein